ncbi:SdiA-regulated domain-containing protein [Pontibacter toksunensis]|uniref:SdiA-regulated domain-containing protein n=1 Tax=Pontibacter toksunensis TaxID=1332631 RepID=A0ABW6BUP0_9BACT
MIKVAAGLIAVAAGLFFILPETFLEAPPTTEAVPNVSASFEKLASLPGAVGESSGIAVLQQKGHYLTHNDAGNKPYLYKLDEQGELVETLKLKLKNVDWEDLAQDESGNIYIADTGNNNNRRRDLAVYKVNLKNPQQVEAIQYSYEDQKKFPPSKKDQNFDSEALFWHDDNLYIITKDRGQGETAKVYQVPAQAGNHKAKLIGSYKTGKEITGADISPDGNTVALLSEERIHLFRDISSPDAFFEGDYNEIEIKGTGQTEGIAFEDNSTVIITSEGGNLYRYKL